MPKERAKLIYESHGMKAFVYVDDLLIPSNVQDLARDLTDFYKIFFGTDEEDWAGVMDDKDVKKAFLNMRILSRLETRYDKSSCDVDKYSIE